MSAIRKATVLFADVSGSTRLYENAGDLEASNAIAGCMDTLRRAVEAAGGRVVKTIGDEIMALFATADAAAAAAMRMHLAVEALPPIKGMPLALRIGFHTGPVVQRGEDVFGDTVNLASRLVGQAIKGQVLTSQDTVAQLSPLARSSTRELYAIQMKGKASSVKLCEFVWRRSPDLTEAPATVTPLPRTVLRIRHAGRELSRRRAGDALLIGRDEAAHLVIADPKASREHCVIERRAELFFLRDQSANGTYLTVEGEPEIVLRREETALRKRGWLAFGQPRESAQDVVEYFCDTLEPQNGDAGK